MDKVSKSIPEAIFNLLLLIVGLVIMVFSIRLDFGSLKQPGAGIFPFFAGLIISISIFIVIIKSIFMKTRSAQSHFKKNAIKILSALGIIFVSWIMMMPFLGYILVTFMASFAFAKVMGLGGWLKPFIMSMLTSLLVYVLFDWLLYLDLPRGLFG